MERERSNTEEKLEWQRDNSCNRQEGGNLFLRGQLWINKFSKCTVTEYCVKIYTSCVKSETS